MKNINVVFVLLLTLQSIHICFAQEWEKWYGKEGLTTRPRCVIEHYDSGIVIGSNVSDYVSDILMPWIIKTNINGDTIWSKLISSTEALSIKNINNSADGGLFLCGGIKINNVSKPFVAKLNACGEKVWCTVFSTYNGSVHSRDVVETSNGEIAVIVNQYDEINGLYLFKLDSSGELLWKKPVCGREEYPDSRAPYGWRVKVTSEGDFIIAGDVYWKNPWDDLYPTRSLFAMINAEGETKWVLPFGLNDSINGHSLNIVEKPNGTFLGLGAYWEPGKNNNTFYNKDKPKHDWDYLEYEYRNGLIMEIDANGSEINHFIADFTNIDLDYKYQVFSDLYFIDSVAVIGGGFNDDVPLKVGEIIIDTNFFDDDFNVYHRIKHENAYEPFSYALTNDSKLLCAATDRYANDELYTYLTKLNRNLEQDSVYTANYEYDYLCDQEIESGTIYFDDCNLILATEEIQTNNENPNQQVHIQLAPNPAAEKIRLNFRNMEYQEQVKLQITSMLGQQVYKTTLIKGQTEQDVVIKKWQLGIYFVQLYSNGKIVGQNRFVKM